MKKWDINIANAICLYPDKGLFVIGVLNQDNEELGFIMGREQLQHIVDVAADNDIKPRKKSERSKALNN